MKKNLTFFLTALVAISCGESFLELKPSLNQRTPSTVADYQALLDYTDNINQNSSHKLAVIGSDEYGMTDARYNAFPVGLTNNWQKRAYTWDAFIYEGGDSSTDWYWAYQRILRINIVLDGLRAMEITDADRAQYDLARGHALFHRALNFYDLAQLYCTAYSDETQGSLGLPLRLEADPSITLPRASVGETYERIVLDLMDCVDLLSDLPDVIFRPSKAAAYALLARTYLQMENYPAALEYSDKCLGIKDDLIDFNQLNATARYAFSSWANGIGNPEVIFMGWATNITPITTANVNMAPELLGDYGASDLRRQLYFHNNTDGRILFKGSYYGSNTVFTGIATDELYLIKAECAVRLGDVAGALATLNLLLAHRHDAGSFRSVESATAEEVLGLVVEERRKELVFRGSRWGDLKRLNKEVRFQKALHRTVNGMEYTLEVGSPRWVWPLPPEAIQAGGYEQNLR